MLAAHCSCCEKMLGILNFSGTELGLRSGKNLIRMEKTGEEEVGVEAVGVEAVVAHKKLTI